MWEKCDLKKNFKICFFLQHCMEAFKPDLLEVSSLGLYDCFYWHSFAKDKNTKMFQTFLSLTICFANLKNIFILSCAIFLCVLTYLT